MKKSLILILLILIIPVHAIEITEVIETESRDTTITRHIYGNGHIADINNNEITYLHQDRIQSTRLSTNSEGGLDKEFKSLPFGQELTQGEIRYSFATGKELDSSGLYYFGARYYDSNLGKFTSVDPVNAIFFISGC